jgi:hypothetical protein
MELKKVIKMSELPPPLPSQEVAQLPLPVVSGENWYSDPQITDRKEISSKSAYLQDIGNSALSSELDISPASKLGVVDGEFRVRRSDGSEEQGWSVRHSTWKDKSTGNIFITVEKPDPENPTGTLVKDVYASDFTSWQEPEKAVESVKSNRKLRW